MILYSAWQREAGQKGTTKPRRALASRTGLPPFLLVIRMSPHGVPASAIQPRVSAGVHFPRSTGNVSGSNPVATLRSNGYGTILVLRASAILSSSDTAISIDASLFNRRSTLEGGGGGCRYSNLIRLGIHPPDKSGGLLSSNSINLASLQYPLRWQT